MIAAVATWRFIPESPVRVPGKVNWGAAALMTIGISRAARGLRDDDLGLGLVEDARPDARRARSSLRRWVAVEARARTARRHGDDADPRRLDDQPRRVPARRRDVRVVHRLPQFAQLPKSTGFGFGASVVVSGLYLLPSTVGMTILGLFAGRSRARFGSRAALIVGTAFTTLVVRAARRRTRPPVDFLIAAGLMGIGIGLAFAALGNLIVQAVPSHQTGVASGMNTVMRTLGGALGGQLSATFIAAHFAHGHPTVTGFTETFWMATGFLLVCLLSGMLVPKQRAAVLSSTELGRDEPVLAPAAAEGVGA